MVRLAATSDLAATEMKLDADQAAAVALQAIHFLQLGAMAEFSQTLFCRIYAMYTTQRWLLYKPRFEIVLGLVERFLEPSVIFNLPKVSIVCESGKFL